MRRKWGFTLIELLVVIGVLAVIAAGIVALIDPVDKLAQANDAKVQNDVGQIATALQSYAAQNSGLYPTSAEYTAGVLRTSGELTTMPTQPTNYTAYAYSVNAGQTIGKVTGQLKAKKNTTAGGVGTWCWDSSLGTAGVYKAAATTALGACP